MSLSYHIVQRPDKHKDAEEGAMLYYGQVRVRQTVSFDRLCETIADRSTASKGDVQLVIDGLLHVLSQNLAEGNVVQVGDFGNFRMNAGSSGAATAEEFTTSLFKNGKIIFTPGSRLKQLTEGLKFEKITPLPSETDEVEDTDDEEDDGPTVQ